MFSTEESDCIVQALMARAYWSDFETASFGVAGKLASKVSSTVRRQAAADIVEMITDHGNASDAQLQALRELVAHSTPEEVTGHVMSYASRLHAGQFDKLGKPYVEHLEAVAKGVPADDELAVRVAWLHDSLEDTDANRGVISVLIGDDGLEAVEAVTHKPHEPRIDYYARVKENQTALTVKRADIAHNFDPTRLSQLDPETRARLSAKYQIALETLNA